MRRLFVTCLALPGLVVSVAGGKSPESTAIAESVAIEVSCEPESAFMQGLIQARDTLTNSERVRWYRLSLTEESGEFVMVGGVKHFITGRFSEKPKEGIVFNIAHCKVVDEE